MCARVLDPQWGQSEGGGGLTMRLKSGAKVTALLFLSCEPLLLPLTEFFRMMPRTKRGSEVKG